MQRWKEKLRKNYMKDGGKGLKSASFWDINFASPRPPQTYSSGKKWISKERGGGWSKRTIYIPALLHIFRSTVGEGGDHGGWFTLQDLYGCSGESWPIIKNFKMLVILFIIKNFPFSVLINFSSNNLLRPYIWYKDNLSIGPEVLSNPTNRKNYWKPDKLYLQKNGQTGI